MGTVKSEIEAYAWLRLAMDDGDDRAKGPLHQIRTSLKPYHVQAGERRLEALRAQLSSH